MPERVIEPPKVGNVVFERKAGNSVCRICNDYVVKTKAEVDTILERCGEIWYRSETRKAREAAKNKVADG